MKKSRLEAFSDGVLAIIITIMVLELKVPEHGDDLKALLPVAPYFLSYVLSFVYVGLYWNNHHHMFYVVDSIGGGALWANLHLLFWLSIMPFTTAWMAESHFAQWPVIVYGFVLIMCSIAYAILVYVLIRHCGRNSALAEAVGHDWKGKASTAIYAVGIAAAFFNTGIALGLYAVVALIWFIPDTRIERKVVHHHKEE